jgi:murein DD-endopeptidase MepM/ murein hydrolase activator NlpD
LYKLRDHGEAVAAGPYTGAAVLTRAELAPPLDIPRPYLPQDVTSGLVAELLRWRARAEVRLRRIDWAPDLAEEIGSRRWFRGLGTLLALTGAALAFWPDFSAVEATTTMPLDRTARDEFRSQSIQPLAFGGDSGRRAGASALVVPLAAVPERAQVDLVATLGQGDNFARMLQRAGVGPGDAARAQALVGAQVAIGEIAPGTRFAVVLGRRPAPGQPRALEKLDFRARFDLALGVVRQPGGLALVNKPIAVDTTPLRIRGTVGGSLYRSARASGTPIEAVQQYLEALDAHLSLDTDIQPGDSFDIIVAYKRSASGETQVGDLLFAGLERGGKPLAQLLRWGSDGQFFEASGMGQQRTGLLMPVVGRITSGFGARRHPILGYTRMHGGVDFGAPSGAPIYAVGDATVAFAGWHGGHGNFVKLEHGGGYGTGYGHMSRIAVSVGTRVRAGQVIGYVGSTGLSTGPHLHYELYKAGVRVNPLSVKFTVSNQVDQTELAAFKAKIAALKAVKPGAAFTSLAASPSASASPRREIDKLGN